jgi:predicted lipid carrier protein YhbT
MLQMFAFKFPSPIPLLARIGPHLPKRCWSDAMAVTLELTRRANALPKDLSILDGKTVCIRIDDLGARAAVRFRNGRFYPADAHEVADVSFQACSADYLKLLRREEDPDTLFFQRRLRIEGNTELGLALKNMLDSIESPDWLMKAMSVL